MSSGGPSEGRAGGALPGAGAGSGGGGSGGGWDCGVPADGVPRGSGSGVGGTLGACKRTKGEHETDKGMHQPIQLVMEAPCIGQAPHSPGRAWPGVHSAGGKRGWSQPGPVAPPLQPCTGGSGTNSSERKAGGREPLPSPNPGPL